MTISRDEEALPAIFIFLIGCSVIAFLAHVWSLFFPITSWLSIFGLPLICTLLYFKNLYARIPKPQLTILLPILFIALVWALASTTNLDEADYYLPTVRWMEQFPVVNGASLFIARIGFNSAFHMLSAVFGYADIINGGVYELNGLLFVWFNYYFITALMGLSKERGYSFISSSILAAALIFPFSFLLSSMDVDYMTIMVGLIVISKLAYHITHSHSFTSNRLFSYLLIICLLFTVKAFSIFLLLPLGLVIYFSKVSKKHLFIAFLLPIAYMIPWLYRNFLISGYLVFPVYFFDLLDAAWKMPKDMVLASYNIVEEFAKVEIIRDDYKLTAIREWPFSEWFPLWIENQSRLAIGWVVMIMTPVSLFLTLVLSIFKRHSNQMERRLILFLFVLASVILLWFISFPAIRFGWAWLLSFMIIACSLSLSQLLPSVKKAFHIALLTSVILSWLKLSYATINAAKRNLPKHFVHTLNDKKTDLTTTYQIGQITISKAENNYCNGTEPPCIPADNPYSIMPLGKSINEGFKLDEE